ncbi:MAG: kelch repeat-containing protein [Nanoarchaeota archaeon]
MDLSSKVNGLTRRDLLNLVKGMGALAFLNTFEPFISLASAEEDLELKIESVKEIQMPTPRKNHGAVVLRDRLYIAGGLDDNNKPNPQVLHTRIKNGEIDKFEETAFPLPKEVHFSGLATDEQFVYAFAPSTRQVLFARRFSTLEALGETGNLTKWEVSEHLLPTNATSTFLCDGKKLYAIAGQDTGGGPQGYHDEVWVSKLDEKGQPSPWSASTSRINGRRSSHAALILKEKLFVLGGWQYHPPFELDDVQVAKLKEGLGKFETVKSKKPKARLENISTVTISGKNYVVSLGGLVGIKSGTPSNEIRAAEVDENGVLSEWSLLGSLPNSVYESASASKDNTIYVTGGTDGSKTYDKVVAVKLKPKQTRLF